MCLCYMFNRNVHYNVVFCKNWKSERRNTQQDMRKKKNQHSGQVSTASSWVVWLFLCGPYSFFLDLLVLIEHRWFGYWNSTNYVNSLFISQIFRNLLLECWRKSSSERYYLKEVFRMNIRWSKGRKPNSDKRLWQ